LEWQDIEMKYEIVPIEKLKPLELVFPMHLKNLEDMINSDGFVLKPILADEKTGTILDGSHRYVYFLKNGYKEIPVVWVNYDDENVRVGRLLSHRFLIENDPGISKKECRSRALSGNLFPPRTTRHFFTFRKTDISLPLNSLKKDKPEDVSDLIADVDISEEINHNKKYIEEINNEIELILQYLEEVSQTKRYLQKQIETMDNLRQVAFFPGKFHPPHIGQIQTILKLIPKYRKLIIGVSGDIPKNPVALPEEIASSLKEVFAHFENVEVIMIKGVLVEKSNTCGLPDFNILLSGNPDVINWANNMKINVEFVERSYGIMCSGTEVRGAINEK
jgi:nicotinamide mononucleotide adenylyltransferase